MTSINTFPSSRIVEKVSKADTYKDLNSDQSVLSMSDNIHIMVEVPLILHQRKNALGKL
jgi:hypothetical protein